MKRLFIIVLDSVGIGELPDAGLYGDTGSNTFAALQKTGKLIIPNLEQLGMLHIDGMEGANLSLEPAASYAKLAEQSAGKDTTTGHWEMAGIPLESPFPTYPNGFPLGIIAQLEQVSGRKAICNLPYSGTDVIRDYGQEHVETGALIVYTSADSVLQIAAHEEIVPLEELYRICVAARGIMQGEHAVGRVIARPFNGAAPAFSRTKNRRDFSITPPSPTMLDHLKGAGLEVIGVGKISDIFSGVGLTRSIPTKSNQEGMDAAISLLEEAFSGLCFVNLVDFDMLYGHRNDTVGYTAAMNEFDLQLGTFLSKMEEEDVLLITADHGCDPSTPSTDHSREYVPMLMAGNRIKPAVNLGVRDSFADIAATVQEYFGLPVKTAGKSWLKDILL